MFERRAVHRMQRNTCVRHERVQQHSLHAHASDMLRLRAMCFRPLRHNRQEDTATLCV